MKIQTDDRLLEGLKAMNVKPMNSFWRSNSDKYPAFRSLKRIPARQVSLLKSVKNQVPRGRNVCVNEGGEVYRPRTGSIDF